MPADRSQRVKQIFQETIDLRGDERDRVLAECCDGDAELLARVAVLLGAERKVRRGFLEGLADLPTDAPFPSRIGRYELVRRIGDGGMGSVFEAVQDSPRRSVALKLLKVGLYSSDALRRFEYETQVLASLRHPGIAQIYEAGTQAIGGTSVPFFAMELVPDARPITEFARAVGLDVPRRLELFIEVCDAVQHGHQKGVIHRDLKPTNIVVDSGGRSRIIDFGVARAVRGDGAAATVVTSPGQIIGTLAYMSPEQCGGDPQDLDIRSDVYSLGVVLYEMLCERVPFDIGRTNVLDAVRIIREESPARPSAVRRVLRGDLETIVLKALDKDRARRYQTAGELAHDVRQFLANEPIEARRDSSLYLLRNMFRRHRTGFAVLIAFVVLVTGSTIVAWSLLLQTRRSEQNAQLSLRESLLTQARARRQITTAGRRTEALDALSKAAAIRTDLDLRNEVISTLAVADVRHRFVPMPDSSVACIISADLSCCAAGHSDGSVSVVRLSDGFVLGRIPAPLNATPGPIKWGVDSRRYIRLFDRVNEPRRLEVWRLPENAQSMAISDVPDRASFDVSPDGRTLAIGRQDHSIHFYDLETGNETRRIELDRDPSYLCFDPSGRRLARFHARDTDASVLDIETGVSQRIFEGACIEYALAWSPDGNLVAGAQGDSIIVWDVIRHKQVAALAGHEAAVIYLAFSHNGRLLASSGWDATIIWDLTTLRPMLRPGLSIPVFSSDDKTIGGLDHTNAGLSQLLIGDTYRLIGADLGTEVLTGHCGALHNNDRLAVSGVVDRDGMHVGLRFFDTLCHRAIGRIDCGRVERMRFDASGSSLFTIGAQGLLRWPVSIDDDEVAIGPPRQLLGDCHDRLFDVSADGTRVVAASPGKQLLTVIDTDHPDRTRSFNMLAHGLFVTVSPKGRWACVSTWQGTGAEVWDLEAGAVVARPPITGSAVAAFSPDGHWLVVREGNWLTFLRSETWETFRRVSVPGFSRLAFSRDSRILVLAANPASSTIRLFDLQTAQELAAFEPPEPFTAGDVAVNHDGSVLALFITRGAMLQLWDMRGPRSTLASMGLDWDLPPLPPAPVTGDLKPLRLKPDLGFLGPSPVDQ